MRTHIWLIIGLILSAYVAAVSLFGFDGPIALIINFVRAVLAVAILVYYAPALANLFKEDPPPRRDFLVMGILFMVLGAVLSTFWNEWDHVYSLGLTLFNSPVGGLVSLLLTIGFYFMITAPNVERPVIPKWLAILIGVATMGSLLFMWPLFR